MGSTALQTSHLSYYHQLTSHLSHLFKILHWLTQYCKQGEEDTEDNGGGEGKSIFEDEKKGNGEHKRQRWWR